MTQEELTLVLEALKGLQLSTDDYYESSREASKKGDEAIALINKALAQPEQEPTNIKRHEANVQKFLGAPKPKEQEPVKLVSYNCKCGRTMNFESVHGVVAPQRTWVGLTDEEAMDVTRKEGHELLDFIYEYGTGSEGVEERIVAICKAIEAKLKEKNT